MQALPAAAGRLGLRVPITVDARRAVGTLALSGLVASGLLVAAGAAGQASSFVPARKGGDPSWLHEPLSSLHLGLGPEGVVLAIFAMWAFYAVTMAFSDAIPARRALGAIVTLHLVFLLGPPLLSTDVFNYVEYGRLGVLHHLNPYTYSPAEVPGDAAFGFIGWPNATTVYGPVFTLGSYATVPLGVGGALWAFKTVMVAASLGCVALVWKAAERLGRPPLEAAMFFGLNPLLLVLAVGGAHNDMLMLFLALAGIVLVLGGRERAGGLAVVGGAAIKASTAILLPYMLVGAHRRGRFLAGALAGAAGAAAIWTVAFHAEIVPFLDTLRWEQDYGSRHSVPRAIGSIVGAPVGSDAIRIIMQALFAVALALTLWSAHRHGNWLVAAGWGTFALLLTTSWLLPWYVVWLLPIAAMTGDFKLGSRRLR